MLIVSFACISGMPEIAHIKEYSAHSQKWNNAGTASDNYSSTYLTLL